MKIDGKEIAKNMARVKKNAELNDDGHVVGKDIASGGTHIEAMNKLIEAIHTKNPAEAHTHMVAYAKSLKDIEDGEIDNK